jgi:two-component sensor histidine kinase
VVWSEHCGRQVARPTREGFGTRLIAQLAKQLRGEITYDWRPTGLRAELRAFRAR